MRNWIMSKSVNKTVRNEVKQQKGGFFGVLETSLVASILGNILAGKPKVPVRWVIWAGEGTITVGEGTTRAG